MPTVSEVEVKYFRTLAYRAIRESTKVNAGQVLAVLVEEQVLSKLALLSAGFHGKVNCLVYLTGTIPFFSVKEMIAMGGERRCNVPISAD
jgi:hypothetical protein